MHGLEVISNGLPDQIEWFLSGFQNCLIHSGRGLQTWCCSRGLGTRRGCGVDGMRKESEEEASGNLGC